MYTDYRKVTNTEYDGKGNKSVTYSYREPATRTRESRRHCVTFGDILRSRGMNVGFDQEF